MANCMTFDSYIVMMERMSRCALIYFLPEVVPERIKRSKSSLWAELSEENCEKTPYQPSVILKYIFFDAHKTASSGVAPSDRGTTVLN